MRIRQNSKKGQFNSIIVLTISMDSRLSRHTDDSTECCISICSRMFRRNAKKCHFRGLQSQLVADVTTFTFRYPPSPYVQRTQDNMPQWTEIKLSQRDVSRTSTPQPNNRTTGGLIAWNNCNENEWKGWKIININMNPYAMPVHPTPFNCKIEDIKWWCKPMYASAIPWRGDQLSDVSCPWSVRVLELSKGVDVRLGGM